jgi:predicted ribosome quality control (RQC) complex YloA/Tae2 family protein
MVEITLDVTKSLEENASDYFDMSKKAKRKIEGAKKAYTLAVAKKESLLKKKDTEIQIHEDSIAIVEKRTRHWFEKFRWFYTSEGFLVVGGRDATTNEILIKKHIDAKDIVFHTDMAGSPFFVIKANSVEGKDIGQQSLLETARGTVTFSKAWKLGIKSTAVFYVLPEQVTKEAQTGEFLPKGAFMIRGKTTYIDNTIDLAIGPYDNMFMAGPVDAIKTHCKDYILLDQGDKKVSEIAKQIRHKFGGILDDIIRVLPAGGFEIKQKAPDRNKNNLKKQSAQE